MQEKSKIQLKSKSMKGTGGDLTYIDNNNLRSYITEVSKIRLLKREEEDMLARKMSGGDEDARKKLIISNLRFVLSIAKNYVNKGVPFLDLINEGNLGLILACDKFDYRKGYRFISYAVWWIRQYIAKSFAEQIGLIRLPMNRALQHFKIKTFMDEHVNEGQTEMCRDTISKVAEKLNMKEKEVYSIIRVTRKSISLDAYVSDKGSRSVRFRDFLEDRYYKLPEDQTIENQLKEGVREALKKLTDKEKRIICYRFGLNDKKNMSLSEIGRKFNVTKERIRQIETRAIRKLKDYMNNRDLKSFMPV